MKWEKVGEIGVDAGIVMVGDPCYYATPDCNSHPAKTWKEFCDLLGEEYPTCKQLNYKLGHPGLGFVVQSGYGDGNYPVFIKKNNEGLIIGLMVKFN